MIASIWKVLLVEETKCKYFFFLKYSFTNWLPKLYKHSLHISGIAECRKIQVEEDAEISLKAYRRLLKNYIIQ